MLRGNSASASPPPSSTPPRPSSNPSSPLPPEGDPRSYQSYQTNGSPVRTATPAPRPQSLQDVPALSSPLATSESHHTPVQEYHNAFTHFGSAADGSPIVPSARPSIPPHRRQQSVPSLLPIALINRATSPERRQRQPTSAEMPFTGDGRGSGRNSDSSQKEGGGGRGMLAGWFSSRGGSTPSSPGGTEEAIPRSLYQRQNSRDVAVSSPDTTPTRRMRTPTTPPAKSPAPPSPSSSSPFAFLTSGMSAISSVLSQQTPPSPNSQVSSPGVNEEIEHLLDLNVEAALYPSQGGRAPTDRDPFSPAAFKNLQVSSAALTRRLQAALRSQVKEARELAVEREAQRDELEEAVTRAAHLKMQLEGMALKVTDQENAMKELVEELAVERRKTARLLSAAAVNAQIEGSSGTDPVQVVVLSEGSVSEDLGVDEAEREQRRLRRQRQQKWRGSGGTMRSEALSFDTEDEESVESESVFSRSRSPTIAQSPFEGGSSTPEGYAPSSLPSPPLSTATAPPQHLKVTALKAVPARHGHQQQQPMTAFQKLVKNVTGGAAGRGDIESYCGPGCANCKGQDASVAWNTVSLLRDENRNLKYRVGELEVAVEGALDLVNGVGL